MAKNCPPKKSLSSLTVIPAEAIPDYQMSAFLMAVFFSGMTDREVSALTERMISSGETRRPLVDSRHESGQTLHRRRGR